MNKTSLCWGALVFLAACGSDIPPSEPPTTQQPLPRLVGSVTIDQLRGFLGRIRFDVRDTTTLTATVRDVSGVVFAERHVAWTSSDPSVATVDSTGLVTAVAEGAATITATSDHKSDTRDLLVIPLNLTAYQLTLRVTDTAGIAIPAVTVYEEYYGPRPVACLSCNIPWGNYIGGVTDSAGFYVGHFVASPEAMNAWSGLAHTYGYVIAKRAGYETDRRWVAGTTTTFTQAIHLHVQRQINAGDSIAVTLGSTDPVFQDLSTDPADTPNLICRTFHVLAASAGVLTVSAVAVEAGGDPVYVELTQPDESDTFAIHQDDVSKSVHAGEVVEVRVVTFVRPGTPARAFMLRTVVR